MAACPSAEATRPQPGTDGLSPGRRSRRVSAMAHGAAEKRGISLFNESQSHFDAPTDVGVQLVDALRSESHPPVPPFGDALVPSAGRRPSSERSAGDHPEYTPLHRCAPIIGWRRKGGGPAGSGHWTSPTRPGRTIAHPVETGHATGVAADPCYAHVRTRPPPPPRLVSGWRAGRPQPAIKGAHAGWAPNASRRRSDP